MAKILIARASYRQAPIFLFLPRYQATDQSSTTSPFLPSEQKKKLHVLEHWHRIAASLFSLYSVI